MPTFCLFEADVDIVQFGMSLQVTMSMSASTTLLTLNMMGRPLAIKYCTVLLLYSMSSRQQEELHVRRVRYSTHTICTSSTHEEWYGTYRHYSLPAG